MQRFYSIFSQLLQLFPHLFPHLVPHLVQGFRKAGARRPGCC